MNENFELVVKEYILNSLNTYGENYNTNTITVADIIFRVLNDDDDYRRFTNYQDYIGNELYRYYLLFLARNNEIDVMREALYQSAEYPINFLSEMSRDMIRDYFSGKPLEYTIEEMKIELENFDDYVFFES